MDSLKEHFPDAEIFRDIEGIEAGADFIETINRTVGSCSVLLAMIGPHWLDATDARGRHKLDDPNDWVRNEIAVALKRDIRVIPILVGDATMPGPDDLPDDLKGLARRQALDVSEKRWDYDVGQLLEVLAKCPGLERRTGRSAGGSATMPMRRRRPGVIAAIVGAATTAVALAIAIPVALSQREPDPPVSTDPASDLNKGGTTPKDDETKSGQVIPPPQPEVTPASGPSTSASAPNQPGKDAAGSDVSKPLREPKKPTEDPARNDRRLSVPKEPAAEDPCGKPAEIAGTWEIGLVGEEPGYFRITQNGPVLLIVGFDLLGQTFAQGAGVLCGSAAELTMDDINYGRYHAKVTFKRSSLTGKATIRGVTSDVRGRRS